MSMSISGATSSVPMHSMSGASTRMSPDQKMSNLFDTIDTSQSGSISKAQFEQAFQSMNPPVGFKSMGADAVFAKLDPNGTGSVSKQDFVDGMKKMMQQIHHGHHHKGNADNNSDSTSGSAQTSPAPSSDDGNLGSNVNVTV